MRQGAIRFFYSTCHLNCTMSRSVMFVDNCVLFVVLNRKPEDRPSK